MKRTMIMIGALMVLIPVMAFAGGSSQASSPKPGQTSLRILNYTDLTVANAAKTDRWQWETFLKANQDVYIVKEDLFNEPFHEKSAAYAASGRIPDVLYVWPAGRSTPLHENRLLKDLTPLLQRDGLMNKYLPVTMDPKLQASGYIAMIPQSLTATHALFVNTEVLKKCGLQPAKTYAELKAQVPVIKSNGYKYTVLMPNKDTWVMQSCMFSMLAGRFCGADWDKRILSGQAKFTDSDFVAALDFVRQLYADGVVDRSCLAIDYGEGPGLFASNQAAYYIDGDWRVGDLLEDEETGKALMKAPQQRTIQITVFPDIEGAKINKTNSTVLGTGWAMSAALPSGSKEEDAAWRLLKWLSGVEVETRMLTTGGISAPSRTDIDYNKVKLAPLSIEMGKLGQKYNTATIVIDDVFHADVYEPINDALVELGMGTITGAQAAATIQAAYDAWKAAQ